jgi:hypothetical protein
MVIAMRCCFVEFSEEVSASKRLSTLLARCFAVVVAEGFAASLAGL